MPVFHDSALIGAAGASGAGAGGYQISRSLRFNSADSAYCLRTPSSNGTSYTTWTWSMWVKRSAPGVSQVLFSAGSNTNDYLIVNFESGDTLRLVTGENGATNQNLVTTAAVFRDYFAWYHIVVQADFDNATQADRIKIYVNGTRQTISGTIATQGYAGTTFNRSGIAHNIGRQGNGVSYFSGYLADVHFIDGQALTPSSFAETDATTGQWVPKAFSGGSYGTNGFRLTFSDNSGTTATTLGKDAAGSNNWTPTNFSVASGAGNDSLVDTPTSYGTDTGAGGEVRGNYATLNPLNYTGTVTLSNGNLDASGSNANASSTIAPNAGKWYAEFVYSAIGAAVGFVGISNRLGADAFNGATQTWQLNYTNTGKLENAGSQSTVSTFTTGDVVGVAFDCSNGQATFYKNGSSVGTITGSAFVGVPVLIGAGAGGVAGTNTFVANFGQRPFAYTAPSGFKALCDTNLPAPVVAKPSTAFDVVTYTGTGATLTATSSLGFSPDLVWIKSRSAATDNTLYDAVRGAQARLESNNTDAEVTSDGGLTAFNSNGFTLGTLAQVNTNTATYVAWCWDEATADGFDIVTYTGNGANRTIAHSLGVAPSFMIVKQRTAASATNWAVWHGSLANTEYMLLNSTAAKATGATYWNSTSPTSSNFSLGTAADVNTNSGTYVAYLWAPVTGYSAFGSYTGNGSADGPFVFCNFRPRFLLVKNSNNTDGWSMWDAARDLYNEVIYKIEPNSSGAEGSNAVHKFDFLSNGFKVRGNWDGINGNGNTIIYAAFAESPFQYARAR